VCGADRGCRGRGAGGGCAGQQQRRCPRLPARRLETTVDPATGQPFKNQGDCVSSAAHSGPASLVVTDTVSANGLGWGFVIGSGLAPNSFFSAGASGDHVAFLFTSPVGADGTVNFGPLWQCGQGLGNFHANATTASGDPINSNTIATSPCG
jgi:hypothetical protein